MKKPLVRKLTIYVLMFGVGIALGVIAGKSGASRANVAPAAALVSKGQAIITVFLSFGVALFLGVLLHELGHVVGGLAARYRFWALIVGIFQMNRVRGRLRFGFNRTLSQALGLVLFHIPDTRRLRSRMLLLIVGGPLASGLAGLAAFGLLYGLDLDAHLTRTAPWPDFALATFLQVFAWVNSLIFVMSAFPAQAGGFYTDGARLRNFLLAARKPSLDVAFTEAYAQLAAGTRPRELGVERWEKLLAYPQASLFKVYCHFYAYYAALDQGALPQARAYLETVLLEMPRINPFSRKGIALEAAIFYAGPGADLNKARHYLSQGGGALTDAHFLYLAEAAVLLAEGKPAAAIEKAAAGLALVPFAYNLGLAQMHREQLQAVLAHSSSPVQESF